ncbi:MAG: hypothetical protein AAFY06_01445 [Pseudomonadota bacterium]
MNTDPFQRLIRRSKTREGTVEQFFPAECSVFPDALSAFCQGTPLFFIHRAHLQSFSEPSQVTPMTRCHKSDEIYRICQIRLFLSGLHPEDEILHKNKAL